jgi:hypothetical protein
MQVEVRFCLFLIREWGVAVFPIMREVASVVSDVQIMTFFEIMMIDPRRPLC